MKRSNWSLFIIVIVLVVLAVGFFKTISNSEMIHGAKLQVAASFYPLYYFTSTIGGDKADVFTVTPAGAEPHDYEPTPHDMVRIEQSKLLILNGAHLEAWADKITSELQKKHIEIVVAGQNLANQQVEEGGKLIQDPHVWLDPLLAKQEANRILEGFKKIDRKNTTYYEKNTSELTTKLDQLHNEYKEGLKNCQKKDIITSHAAFGYLAREYGFNQVAITGISPDEDPTAQKLADIADFVKKNDIKYIFFESLVSPKLSETIAQEAGAQTLVLDPIEGLTSDEMKKGSDYISIMRDNLKNLRLALVCQ